MGQRGKTERRKKRNSQGKTKNKKRRREKRKQIDEGLIEDKVEKNID